ncbi:DUF732 domain-containing protein [Mycolicibacterium sp. Dal123E01]|uniref:DUF732 domain-containing protein n=1 Tax=Mycolicibacterium sp. Dal123E01 TaxID=3457578 RepID=UPI00403E7A23
MKTLLGAMLATAAIGGVAVAAQASATPPCQLNWELGSDGQCHPYYSTPTNGYDPYDPSGQGFLRGLGPDSSWESGGPATSSQPGSSSTVVAPNEQKFVSDLAAYDLRPTRTVREFVNLGWGICRMLQTKSNGAVIDDLYQQGNLSRQQLQILINVSQNRLCPP